MLHVERKLVGNISVVRSGFSLMCLVYTLLPYLLGGSTTSCSCCTAKPGISLYRYFLVNDIVIIV